MYLSINCLYILIDVNSELFPSKQGDRITIAFASTLSLQGIPDDGSYNPNMGVCMCAYAHHIVSSQVVMKVPFQ